MTSTYQKLKAEGGPKFLELLAKKREQQKRSRSKLGRVPRDRILAPNGRKSKLVQKARARARGRGLDASLSWREIEWPTHCPVLGIPLIYEGGVPGNHPNIASLDRWDNNRGYTADNVFVISRRANELKRNGTWEELEAVARYAKRPPAPKLLRVEDLL